MIFISDIDILLTIQNPRYTTNDSHAPETITIQTWK